MALISCIDDEGILPLFGLYGEMRGYEMKLYNSIDEAIAGCNWTHPDACIIDVSLMERTGTNSQDAYMTANTEIFYHTGQHPN